MKTKRFISVGLINKKSKKTEYIVGTDYNQEIVVNCGYFTTYSRDYTKYIFGIDDEKLNYILETLKNEKPIKIEKL